MNEAAIGSAIAPGDYGRTAIVGPRRQRASWTVYAVMLAIGTVLWVAGPSPAWRAFGLGLFGPGLGFLASGDWGMLLIPVTLALFAAAIFFWFAAGAIVFPVFIWIGSAGLAAALTGNEVWGPAPFVAAASVAGAYGYQAYQLRRKSIAQRAVAKSKFGAMDKLVAAARARATPRPEGDRELSPEMLSAARYLLDRALQPVQGFDGFDQRDIFQTASVRYQINFIGYALAILQNGYTPAFHGYLSRAQRQLIEKYLVPKVWNYWVYESIWGHLNFTNWDPADKDNIMLTGYFGSQVNLYMHVTGDRRYAEPGSLTFRLNDRNIFPHDAHSINRSLVDNFERSVYCLYPCEPNWIYPACNFRGMLSLVAYDKVFGTSYSANLSERFWHALDTEFTDEAGSIVSLRSSLTGMPFPFPGSDLSFAPMANVFAPERAERLWAPIAMGLRGALIETDAVPALALPNTGIDFGNYRPGARAMAACSIMQIAREFGDDELADAARQTLRVHGQESCDGGALSFAAASNMANAYAMQGVFARRDDIRAAWLDGPAPGNRHGPLLECDSYPDVLVAAAHSGGEDLRLVLYPGSTDNPVKLDFARLRSGQRYMLDGVPGAELVADAEGSASVTVPIRERTPLHLRPAP